jgi:hypothetical protein
MLIHILALFLGLQSQQELESQIRQRQLEIEQLAGLLREERRQAGELKQVVARQEQELRRPFCSADLSFVGASAPRIVAANPNASVSVNLHGTVSRPANVCLPAEIRVTASYLDAADNLICSGVVENIASQTSSTQSINLLIRPWNMQEFVRWRNEPPQVNTGYKRLSCMDADGLSEANTEALERVRTVRIRVTLLPAAGGISAAETMFQLQR